MNPKPERRPGLTNGGTRGSEGCSIELAGRGRTRTGHQNSDPSGGAIDF